MPRVTFEGLVRGIRGKVGDLIYRLMPDGTTVVSRVSGKKRRRFSQKQKAHQSRFSESAAYAQEAAEDEPIYAELAAATVMRTAYNFALSDWWHAPVIHRIQRHEGRILVEATDNVMVARVQVTVLDGEGNVLEKGDAAKGTGDWWEFPYRSEAEGKKIVAQAWDLPRNLAEFVLE